MYLNKYLLLACFVFFKSSRASSTVKFVNSNGELVQVDYDEDQSATQMNSSVYRTAKKYICFFDEVEHPEMIIYGTNSWDFPKQDVNLTLVYPARDRTRSVDLETGPYVITGFTVILFVDTTDTRGYITKGGVMTDEIELTFECNDVTTLMYEFWVYGLPAHATRLSNFTFNSGSSTLLCNPPSKVQLNN